MKEIRMHILTYKPIGKIIEPFFKSHNINQNTYSKPSLLENDLGDQIILKLILTENGRINTDPQMFRYLYREKVQNKNKC